MFLDRLSRLSRIVNVTTLKMTVDNSRDASPDLKMTGVATTFRFLEPTEGAAVKTSAPAAKGKGA